MGLRSAYYDREKKSEHDINSTTLVCIYTCTCTCHILYRSRLDMFPRRGFLLMLQYVLRVVPGGMLFSGVPCNGHVWISRGSTGKSRQNPIGDTQQACTRTANQIASRWALGALVGCVRAVLWVVEQPGSSLLPRLPWVHYLMQLAFGGFGFAPAGLIRL